MEETLVDRLLQRALSFRFSPSRTTSYLWARFATIMEGTEGGECGWCLGYLLVGGIHHL
jgi:hypothetical protein